MEETIKQKVIGLVPVKLLIVADTHGRLDDRIAGLADKCDIAVHCRGHNEQAGV